MKLMFHYDDCGALLDSFGRCHACRFYPDMQSTAFREVAAEDLEHGVTYLGIGREPVGVLPTGSAASGAK